MDKQNDDPLLSQREGYDVINEVIELRIDTITVLKKEPTKVELLETLHYNNGNCQS